MDGIKNIGGGVNPTGTVISYFGETAPDGYLICDGTAYDKSAYPELSEHLLSLSDTTPYVVTGDETKFRVPDLRGEFLRGTGTNSHEHQGSGENVGEHQDGTKHVDVLTENNNIYIRRTNSTDVVVNGDYYDGCTTWTGYIYSHTGTFSSATDGMFTSRPTNTSVLYCIKY